MGKTIMQASPHNKTYTEGIHEDVMLLKCNICNTIFVSKEGLENHNTALHSHRTQHVNLSNEDKEHDFSVHEGKKPFKSKKCDYISVQKDTISSHYRR